MTKARINLQRRKEIGEERKARTRARIFAAAFDLYGNPNGLYTRVEDITSKAGITRPTFYGHFSSLDELRSALTYEVMHEFLGQVKAILAQIDDPAERTAVAIRYYLKRALVDEKWARSMIIISIGGFLFGAETAQHALTTIEDGIRSGRFSVRSAVMGRDIVLGTTFGAICSILRGEADLDGPEVIAAHTLTALGVPLKKAREIATMPLPSLPQVPAPFRI